MSAILGQGHSPFSRFSPLGGQLLFFASIFTDRAFSVMWGGLSQTNRFQCTLAAFHALNALFKIWSQWRQPKFENSVTYCRATLDKTNSVTMLLPCVSNTLRTRSLLA